MENHPDNAHLPVINRRETIVGVTVTFLAVAVVAASLRLFVRRKAGLLSWDDLFVGLATLSTIIGSSLTCFMPDTGLGLHLWTLDENTVMEYFKHIWATNITYTSSTTFIKLAILLQYTRLFDFRSKVARILTFCMIALVSIWGIIFFCLALFSCRPIEKNWNYKLPGKCVGWGTKDPDTFFPNWAAHGATNMLIDILILVLPIPFLRGLRMEGKTRIGLIGLFIVGTIVTSMSICRMVALSINRAGTIPILDMTFHTPPVYIFSILEVNLAIMLASIPIFWPLVISIASNKILVVNEVEVRTDIRDSQNIRLSEQGGSYGFEMDGELDKGGRTSRLSILVGGKDDRSIKEPSRLQKALSKRHQITSRSHNRSNPASHHSPSRSIVLSNRISSESQQNLAHQPSSAALSSFSSSPPDPNHTLDPSRNASITHYQDRYVQDWVVPGFDKDSNSEGTNVNGAPDRDTGNRTVVERAEVPFDHLRALDK